MPLQQDEADDQRKRDGTRPENSIAGERIADRHLTDPTSCVEPSVNSCFSQIRELHPRPRQWHRPRGMPAHDALRRRRRNHASSPISDAPRGAARRCNVTPGRSLNSMTISAESAATTGAKNTRSHPRSLRRHGYAPQGLYSHTYPDDALLISAPVSGFHQCRFAISADARFLQGQRVPSPSYRRGRSGFTTLTAPHRD